MTFDKTNVLAIINYNNLKFFENAFFFCYYNKNKKKLPLLDSLIVQSVQY